MSQPGVLDLSSCTMCPRRCGIDRTKALGFCKVPDRILAAKAMIHEGEEPCIIGRKPGRYGAGAIFFSGCNLRCVFCQNQEISLEGLGWEISEERLGEIFLELQDQGAYCIDLVSATPYLPFVVSALRKVRESGDLFIPVVYNCGGYESVEAIRALDGLIDIYMPDLKYYDTAMSERYSKASDYFEKASAALKEMISQVGEAEFDEEGFMKKGVLIRHLVLPGGASDSEKLMDFLGTLDKKCFLVSVLRQYTPFADSSKYPEIHRRITTYEYEKVVKKVIENDLPGYRQAKSSSTMALRPVFDGEGIKA